MSNGVSEIAHQAYEDRRRDVEKFLRIDRPWTALSNTDESRMPNEVSGSLIQGVQIEAKTKVSFAKRVEVRIEVDSNQYDFQLPCLSTQFWQRSISHMHGQMCTDGIKTAIENVHRIPWSHVGEATHEPRSQDGSDASYRQKHVNDRARDMWRQTNQDALIFVQSKMLQAAESSQSSRSAFLIDTWYLCPQRFQVCIRSRSFRMERDWKHEEFLQACREAWIDIMLPEPFHVEIVQPQPTGMKGTIAHIIFSQRVHDGETCHIFHSEAFPPLQQNRALIVGQNQRVRQIFAAVQIRTVCIRPTTMCCIDWFDGHQMHKSCDVEEV